MSFQDWIVPNANGDSVVVNSSLIFAATNMQAYNNLDVSGNLNVSGIINGGTSSASLIPDTDNVFNIGSLTNRWATLYLGTDANISGNINAGDITAGGNINATDANISGSVNSNIAAFGSPSNQITLGTGNTVTLNAVAPTSNVVVEFPDVLNPTNTVAYLNGTQAFNGAKFFLVKPLLAANGEMLQFQNNGVGNTINITAPNPASGNRVYSLPDAGADGSIMVSSQGTVTQLTSLVTPVILDQSSGVITTVTATTAAASTEQFVVNNSLVTASSVVLACVCNYSGTYATNGFPQVNIQSVTGGSFTVAVSNMHAANALNGILKISFVVC